MPLDQHLDMGFPQATDAELVRTVLRGETSRYAEVVRRYQVDVRRVIAGMGTTLDELEELVQEVFVSAYERLDTFDRQAHLGRWLKGIARNTVRMRQRTLARRQRHYQLYREHLLRLLSHDQSGDRWQQDLLHALNGCRQHLGERASDVLDLRYADGLSADEIGEAIGSSAQAVNKMLSRSRLLLRDCIERQVSLG